MKKRKMTANDGMQYSALTTANKGWNILPEAGEKHYGIRSSHTRYALFHRAIRNISYFIL
jgi:hypothetical protein